METVFGLVKEKSKLVKGCVWLLLATAQGTQVVRVESDPLVGNVHDSVSTGTHLIVAGEPVTEIGPSGEPRTVIVASHAGFDLLAGNAMVITGQPRPFYLTDNLTVTDSPDPHQQVLQIA